jgi:hypothetical protein
MVEGIGFSIDDVEPDREQIGQGFLYGGDRERDSLGFA